MAAAKDTSSKILERGSLAKRPLARGFKGVPRHCHNRASPPGKTALRPAWLVGLCSEDLSMPSERGWCDKPAASAHHCKGIDFWNKPASSRAKWPVHFIFRMGRSPGRMAEWKVYSIFRMGRFHITSTVEWFYPVMDLPPWCYTSVGEVIDTDTVHFRKRPNVALVF